ncbi:MAG: diaminopimelate epimerase [Oligoflexia bacterium]|nr:MAG: diaminopimelate epimerase [Oligoflexia bacterium]
MKTDLSKTTMTRLSAANNTFVFLMGENVPQSDRTRLTQILCASMHGFQNDGVVFIDPSSKVEFSWDFYNADGSSAEMCGNAARCAMLYYNEKIDKKSRISFETRAGLISVEKIEGTNQVMVQMTKTKFLNPAKDVKILGQLVRGALIDTGVPHFVIQAEPDEDIARELRKSNEFGPAGANITFIEIAAESDILAVTFERGVENFTMACGTGAVAAAESYRFLYPKAKSVLVEMPGGQMEVDWSGDDSSPRLRGAAQIEIDFTIYKGLYEKL